MVSQNAIPSQQHLGGSAPFVFTEQGVAMLSSVIRSNIAVDINIKIMRQFVQMRKNMLQLTSIFQKFQQIDEKLLTHDKQFNQIFKAIEQKQLTPTQGVFYDGQLFEAHTFIVDLIKQAKEQIILIDNYVDETTLTLLAHKNTGVKVTIYTKEISSKLELAVKKFTQQYDNLELKEFTKSHDRFLIIDKQTYHIGASLKDLGKKWFAFSKMNDFEMVQKL